VLGRLLLDLPRTFQQLRAVIRSSGNARLISAPLSTRFDSASLKQNGWG
jgi:hypothetical protein